MSLLNQGYNRARVVTKSDSVNDVFGPCDALYIGTKGSTGTAVVVFADGQTATFVGLAAGTILPVRVIRLNSTTTDVSDVLALYIQ